MRLRFTAKDNLLEVLNLCALSGIHPNRLMIDSRTVKAVELVDANLLVLACGSSLSHDCVLASMLDSAGITKQAFEAIACGWNCPPKPCTLIPPLCARLYPN